MAKYGNNPKIAQFMTDKFPHPYTIERAKNFIDYANQISPLAILAIDLAGEVIGGIGLHPLSDIQRKNAELGY